MRASGPSSSKPPSRRQRGRVGPKPRRPTAEVAQAVLDALEGSTDGRVGRTAETTVRDMLGQARMEVRQGLFALNRAAQWPPLVLFVA